MTGFLLNLLGATWGILKEASLFLLFGLIIAGILAVLVPQRLLSRLLGTGKIRSVLWASTIGAPLPLCSCGVLPTALGLRKQGATPGATVSFLIATPETGVDSIALTYALMDPLVTVFRPVAAVCTAIVAGIATNFLGAGHGASPDSASESPHTHAADADGQHAGAHHDHDHAHEAIHPAGESNIVRRAWTLLARVYHYAFRDLLDETSYWLVLGIVLSGLIAVALPTAFLDQYLGNELTSMLVMAAIGIPLYICASASTPLAAALVLKGLNPGAALVFLLSGPATNIGSVVVLVKFLGLRVIAVYLASIAVVAIAAGLTLNWIYRAWHIDALANMGKSAAIAPEPVKVVAAIVLLAFLALSLWRTRLPQEWVWLWRQCIRLAHAWFATPRLRYATLGVVGLAYLASGLYRVQPGEQAVESRFGVLLAPATEPGLHYRLPWPIQSHTVVATQRIARIEIGFREAAAAGASSPIIGSQLTVAGWNNPTPEIIQGSATWFKKELSPEDESFFLTGDGNLIKLRAALQFRIKDPFAYLNHVADSEALLRGTLRAAMRGVVARREIDAIYTNARAQIEAQVAQSVQRALDRVDAGLEVVAFRLLYVHAPDEVHAAFREVASAQEDKQRTINRAHIFAVEGVNEAKAEAVTMLEQAAAFREQQVLRATGDAAGFAVRLEEYRRAPELTKFRIQIEALDEILPGKQKFIQPGAGAVRELDLWLLQPPASARAK